MDPVRRGVHGSGVSVFGSPVNGCRSWWCAELEIAIYSFDIIILAETHLGSSILDAELISGEYCVNTRDREHGGRTLRWRRVDCNKTNY